MKKKRKRKKETNWFRRTLLAVYVLAIVWTSLAYMIGNRVAASTAPSPGTPLRVIVSPARRMNVRSYVQNAAKAAGVSPRVAEWIVSHESRHRPEATGDGGESRGLWQINRDWHPEVSDACAYDVRCSTDWSLERIRSGHSNEWSTWKFCRQKFGDCPF